LGQTVNILEQIAEMCQSRRRTTLWRIRQLSKIRRVAEQNANMLTQIPHDYVRQNDPDPRYRKQRLKAAKRMLGK